MHSRSLSEVSEKWHHAFPAVIALLDRWTTSFATGAFFGLHTGCCGPQRANCKHLEKSLSEPKQNFTPSTGKNWTSQHFLLFSIRLSHAQEDRLRGPRAWHRRKGPVPRARPCDFGDLAGDFCGRRVAEDPAETAGVSQKKRLALHDEIPQRDRAGRPVWLEQPEEFVGGAAWDPAPGKGRTAIVSFFRSNQWRFFSWQGREGDCFWNNGAGQPNPLESAVRSSAGRRRFWDGVASHQWRRPHRVEGGASRKSKVAAKHEEGDMHFASAEPPQHHQSRSARICGGSG